MNVIEKEINCNQTLVDRQCFWKADSFVDDAGCTKKCPLVRLECVLRFITEQIHNGTKAKRVETFKLVVGRLGREGDGLGDFDHGCFWCGWKIETGDGSKVAETLEEEGLRAK